MYRAIGRRRLNEVRVSLLPNNHFVIILKSMDIEAIDWGRDAEDRCCYHELLDVNFELLPRLLFLLYIEVTVALRNCKHFILTLYWHGDS